ncbi:MAG: TIGR03668 family PPOX class F420-dependent oxidoreductase [Thermodesulfobacteriota bacterium]
MITIPNDQEREILLSERVARMATADGSGRPHVVPVCFAYDGHNIFTPLDKKPKSVPAGELRRVKNILSNPRVSLVVDGYYEDWKRLYYVLVYGLASVIESGEEYRNSLILLSRKYPQYRKMGLEEAGLPVIKIVPESIVSWGNP